jgi:hypothetical protein
MVPATLVAVLVAPALTGCGLLEGSSRVEAALEYLPDDATTVTFLDRATLADRLDLADVDADSSEDEIADYVRAMAEAGGGTELTTYLHPMLDGGAAFTDLDVEWQAVASADGLGRVWKMADDLDFDAVHDDLVDAGYDATEEGDVRRYRAELSEGGALIGDRYPALLLGLAVVPDEQLIVSGDVDGVDAVLATVAEDRDSLSDSGAYDDVLADEPEDLEATLLWDDPSCGSPGILSPEAAERTEQERDGLGTPHQQALYVAAADGDPTATTVLAFADDDAAQADLAAREDYLSDAVDPRTGEPLDEYADWEIERDGSLVLVTAEYDAPARAWGTAIEGQDPFAACPPDAEADE